MNRVELMGRLTKDPETREAGQTVVTKFMLAVDRRIRKDGEQNADFIRCVAFDKTAEFVGEYFGKGSRIAIAGRIQTGQYTDKDGKTVYTTEVIAECAEFCESKRQGETSDAPKPAPGDEFVKVEDGWEAELPFN